MCSMLILLDQAESSGSPRWTEKQSCPSRSVLLICVSTWNRLISLKKGVLKSALKAATAHGPSPVLSDAHLATVDQWLLSVLATMRQYTDQSGMDTVLVKTGCLSPTCNSHQEIGETDFYKTEKQHHQFHMGADGFGSCHQQVLVVEDRIAMVTLGFCVVETEAQTHFRARDAPAEPL